MLDTSRMEDPQSEETKALIRDAYSFAHDTIKSRRGFQLGTSNGCPGPAPEWKGSGKADDSATERDFTAPNHAEKYEEIQGRRY